MGPNRETDRIGLSMMLVFEERRSSRHRRQLCPQSRSLLMVGLSDCVGKKGECVWIMDGDVRLSARVLKIVKA
jgi:hypothetical protein